MGVTGDTLVLTSDGYQQVCDLVNEVFSVIADNNKYSTVGYGFFSSKNCNVYITTIQNGSYLKASADHEVLLSSGRWVRIEELKPGDKLKLSDEHEDGTVVGIGYVGCFYVYDCSIQGNKYVTEGGFYNRSD